MLQIRLVIATPDCRAQNERTRDIGRAPPPRSISSAGKRLYFSMLKMEQWEMNLEDLEKREIGKLVELRGKEVGSRAAVCFNYTVSSFDPVSLSTQ